VPCQSSRCLAGIGEKFERARADPVLNAARKIAASTWGTISQYIWEGILMTRADILTRFESIIRDLFDEYDGPITANLSAKDVEQWDSLANVQLAVMVEKAFKVKFTAGEIGGLKDLGAMADLVAKRAKP
jgi:acyl carrier protein